MGDIVETLQRLGAQARWDAVEEAGSDEAGALLRAGIPAEFTAYFAGAQPLNGMIFPAEEEEQEEEGGEDEQSPPAAPSE
ncbi:MAG TPA: hypothetical protein VFW82_13565 [Dyella sp.]|nr:hypothetical protein [Dyella sp.]